MEQITPKVDFDKELNGLFDASGKVAYVPGGYGGIGEALCWGLAKAGAKVVISGRSAEKGEELARAIKDAGYEATNTTVDVNSVDDIKKSTDFVAETYGRLDILMNCVGIQREERLWDVTEEAYDEVYRVNLKSAMFLAQAAARHQMGQGDGGKQCHLLSVRSQLGIRDRGYSAYCSTKGAMVMLVKQHAMELAPHNITVNGVAPTFVYTEMIRHVMENPEFRKALLARIPLGRIADPKDCVGPCMFFCTPASNFVTGQTVYVDGGITSSQ
ncbi:MAG: SDR family oxidoreductase [Planctomycetota bacterium]|nr:SDR family oxidoreductase [Planctomycetota bacterium]MDA1138809.1 SDR family oxidoreductase [Planctomycetota bacterium]